MVLKTQANLPVNGAEVAFKLPRSILLSTPSISVT
jgi:hypothetical protein